MDERFEKHGVLVKKTEEWEKDLYGFDPFRIGDCISDMMWLACYDPKYAEYIPICAKLLKEGKRWPDGYQEEHSKRIAKTKMGYGLSKLRHWFGMLPVMGKSDEERAAYLKKVKPRLYRTQHGMTRDPYTHFFAACKINDMWDQAEDVHPPRSIYSPTFWAWQKYLHTGDKKWLNRYINREYRGTPARQYVKDMALVRARSADCFGLWSYIDNLEVKPNKG